MIQRFTIPGRLPGLNEVTDSNRADPRSGARLKRETQEAIMWAVRSARITPITAPVSLLIIWVEKTKRRDLDNVYSGKKMILDALVEMGILQGDGQKYVTDIHDYHATDNGNPRIEVTLIERD